MGVTFIHTGDWHIGKPFGRFGAEQGSVLRRARLTAIDRLAVAAVQRGAAHVLVAGDVYDQPGLADKALKEPLSRMKAHVGLQWHIIPGNHDPVVTGSVWERVGRDGLTGNVHIHLETRPVRLGEGAVLLPAPLAAKSMSRDPTAWMGDAETPAGAIRIGLAHGATQGFGSERTASINIAADRAERAGLDYLALGDWHGVRQIGPRCWYAGTPEPDDYLDNMPGHALLVRVEGARAPPVVEMVEVGEFRWMRRAIDVEAGTDLAALEREVAGLGAKAGRLLLQVHARGGLSLDEDRALAERLDAIDTAVFHLSRRLDEVQIAAHSDDLARLEAGPVRAVGEALAQMAADAASRDGAVARRALRRLFAMTAALGADT